MCALHCASHFDVSRDEKPKRNKQKQTNKHIHFVILILSLRVKLLIMKADKDWATQISRLFKLLKNAIT